MKFKLFFLICYFLGTSIGFTQMSSWEVVESMGRGLNIGNTLSAPTEGNWAPAIYEQYFIDVANAGFSNVRIPADFFGSRTSGTTSNWSANPNTSNQYNGSIADFSVNPSYLNRVETVVDWSLNQGLYTVIDFHGAQLKSEFLDTFNASNSDVYTSPSSAKRAADLMKFKSIWIQIANRFVNHPEQLIFEVVNEPYFEVSAAEMNVLNAMIIEAIRSTGGNNSTRSIIITGGTSTSYQAPTTIGDQVLNSDPYLIASFHYYQPFNFTASSREQYTNYTWGSNADKNTINNHFNSVRQWSEANNIPVTLGEFAADNADGINYETGVSGAFNGPENASRVEYHRYLAEQAINRGFSFSAWCAGNKSTKSIHLRTDNPQTNNVISGTWVEDVKEALLADGDWPECYGPSSADIIKNPDFECGYSNNWSLSFQGNAAATFSAATASVFSGSTAARVDVTSSQNYNRVLLSNVVYEEDLSDKKLTVGCYVRAFQPGISFRLRFKSQVNGSTTYVPSEIFQLSTNFQYYEFEYEAPQGTSSVQLQALLGADVGTYILDNFSIQVEDTSLGLPSYVSSPKLILFPNPVKDFLFFKSDLNILNVKLYNILGELVFEKKRTNQIYIGQFLKGLYFIKAEFDNGIEITNKFIID
jgi:endoglucanase